MKRTQRTAFVLSLMAVAFLSTGRAADDPADKTTSTASNSTELAKLKAQIEEQQKQIEQLSAMLAAQKENGGPAHAGRSRRARLRHGSQPAEPGRSGVYHSHGSARSARAGAGRVRTAGGSRGDFVATAVQDWRCHRAAHRIHGFHGRVQERKRRRLHRQQFRQRAVR